MTTDISTLTGVGNFRDFGGWPTHDGRTVHGQLFRSAHFGGVALEEVAALDALGVQFMVDLRRPDERAHTPNRWAPTVTLVRDPSPDATEGAGGPGGVGRPVMQATYARIPLDPRFIGLLGDLFRALAAEGGPVIIHCSAGKDRTGVACALLLATLGVDRASILQDYLATNAAIDRVERARLARADLEPVHGPLSDELIDQVIGVEAAYLQASFDAIAREHGSVAGYVERVLGVTPAISRTLQSRLLAGGTG